MIQQLHTQKMKIEGVNEAGNTLISEARGQLRRPFDYDENKFYKDLVDGYFKDG